MRQTTWNLLEQARNRRQAFGCQMRLRDVQPLAEPETARYLGLKLETAARQLRTGIRLSPLTGEYVGYPCLP